MASPIRRLVTRCALVKALALISDRVMGEGNRQVDHWMVVDTGCTKVAVKASLVAAETAMGVASREGK